METTAPALVPPILALVLWTLVIWIWMYATRIPAIQRANLDAQEAARTRTLNLPPEVMWVSDNYNHLMEQPTIFYAVAIVIALTGTGNGVNAWLAWGYAGLRIVHSLVQATVNKVGPRFVLFVASTLCLVALTLHAAMAVFHG